MHGLSENQVLYGLLALAAILIVGRGVAELARRLGQPEVLGELLAGFVLGPSVLGALLPGVRSALFENQGVGVALSAFSWVGAILLLLIAGLEVDLGVLRQQARPGALAAAFAIVPSFAAGTAFAWLAFDRPPPDGLFLGVVLSVTAVSVAAKILIERGDARRGFAQVILAAGIASEVLVWLLVSVVASFKDSSPLLAGARSFVFAVLFFAFMLTLGRRFTFWAMRRMADLTQIANGQLTLVLTLAFLSAALTQRLGLHALLGAFVFGVLLSRAPRANLPLKQNVQTLTVGLFAPVFFVLAGMRVDIFALGRPSAIGALLVLFVVATLVKAGGAMLGARLGGLGGWEAAVVGLGVNLKGGTDVIVAILGAELGLLSARAYAMYAVVAILTVLVTPPLLNALRARTPPSPAELERLNREEARGRAYLPRIERALVPLAARLFPERVAPVLDAIARAKGEQAEFFDITRLALDGRDRDRDRPPAREADAARETASRLDGAGALAEVEVLERRVATDDPVAAIVGQAGRTTLIAIGAERPASDAAGGLSLGAWQDRIIDAAAGDVLVAVGEPLAAGRRVERILVPVNGFEHSLKAGDIAAYLARATGAELVLFTVIHPRNDAPVRRKRDRRAEHGLRAAGSRVLREAATRVEPLGVRARERVELGDDPGAEILRELQRRPYDLLVMGAVNRSVENRLYLGARTAAILKRSPAPSVLLVSHEAAGEATAT